jgi:hypothetical protein
VAQFVAQSEVRLRGAPGWPVSTEAPSSPPGGSDLPLHRLPENSPVEAVTLGALSRALVQVVMFTLCTPVPAKLASRGGDVWAPFSVVLTLWLSRMAALGLAGL